MLRREFFVFFFSVILYISLSDGAARIINLGKQLEFFQGDIHDLKNSHNNALVRNSANQPSLWESNIIYYEVGAEWSERHVKLLAAAMKEIEDNTCIRFAERTNQPHYIKIENSTGCFSAVGKIGLGGQTVSLFDSAYATCWVHPTVVHELLHAVGLPHEQMRSDRDDYLYLFMENVDPERQGNFAKCLSCNNYGVPYNYLSVMHYDITAFSTGERVTMLPKDMVFSKLMGDAKNGHSFDYEKVRKMYSCPRSNVTCYECEATSINGDCKEGQCRGEVCYTSVWPDRIIKGCGDSMYTFVGCRDGAQGGQRNTICGCTSDRCNGDLSRSNMKLPSRAGESLYHFGFRMVFLSTVITVIHAVLAYF